MKSLLQATFAAITIATLAGCATVSVQEMAQGKLDKAVSIVGVTPAMKTLQTKTGLDYQEMRFVINGKEYDRDGRITNAAGYRVLNNGEVCVPVKIEGKDRYFVESYTSQRDYFIKSCSFYRAIQDHQESAIVVSGIVMAGLGSIGAAAAAAATIKNSADYVVRSDMTDDEVVEINNKWANQFN